MPSPSPESLQHLLKLLRTVSDQETIYFGCKGSATKGTPRAALGAHSLGDGMEFLEKFINYTGAEPLASSTPHHSPRKSEVEKPQHRCLFKNKFFSMPELRTISPILDEADGKNASGPSNPRKKRNKKRKPKVSC